MFYYPHLRLDRIRNPKTTKGSFVPLVNSTQTSYFEQCILKPTNAKGKHTMDFDEGINLLLCPQKLLNAWRRIPSATCPRPRPRSMGRTRNGTRLCRRSISCAGSLLLGNLQGPKSCKCMLLNTCLLWISSCARNDGPESHSIDDVN